jgi:glutamate 5-kinase
MIVCDGRMSDVLVRILDHEPLGTLFVPSPRKLSSRSRWIGSARPVGSIVVDDGAVKALVERNRSLLPAGVTAVKGQFEKGDVVAIESPAGQVIAHGLSNYPAAVIGQIQGKKTQEVRVLLGEAAYDEVIHRNNLVVS